MKPLVFVHGFMGGARQWAAQAETLADLREVVTVDLPGFGANHAMPAPDSIGGFAAYVLETLSAAGIGRFDLLGHSMGGMIAQEMVARAPERVARLVLYGTGASGMLADRFETFEVSKQQARTDGPKATARRISATWFLDRDAAPGYPGCAAIAELSSLQAILAGLDAMSAWDRTANLAEIRCPALVLWGDGDRTYSWAQTEQLWTAIPGASLAVVPGCAHAVHLEKPEIFNALVRDFL